MVQQIHSVSLHQIVYNIRVITSIIYTSQLELCLLRQSVAMAISRCILRVRIFGICTALGGLGLILYSIHPYICDLLNLTDTNTNSKVFEYLFIVLSLFFKYISFFMIDGYHIALYLHYFQRTQIST